MIVGSNWEKGDGEKKEDGQSARDESYITLGLNHSMPQQIIKRHCGFRKYENMIYIIMDYVQYINMRGM